jgi:hypothetical protein
MKHSKILVATTEISLIFFSDLQRKPKDAQNKGNDVPTFPVATLRGDVRMGARSLDGS